MKAKKSISLDQRKASRWTKGRSIGEIENCAETQCKGETEMASHNQKRNSRNSRGQFITGHNGGPGRPRGSRNKLTEQFFADLCADWELHGAGTMEIVRRDHPVAYFRTVASLLRPAPDPGLITGKYAEMTDAELFDELSSLIESFPPDIRASREKQSELSPLSKKGRSPED
jgi:hypothetical protein